jgi:hypothetical protein
MCIGWNARIMSIDLAPMVFETIGATDSLELLESSLSGTGHGKADFHLIKSLGSFFHLSLVLCPFLWQFDSFAFNL